MELWFLGTGAGDFEACQDPSNVEENVVKARKLGGRNLRDASQALLTPDILIDFYSDRQLVQQDVETNAVEHLLISHCHGDHFQPSRIVAFAEGLPERLNVYGNETAEAGLEFLSSYVWDEESSRFKHRTDDTNTLFHAIRPGQTLTMGDARVTAVLANHHVDSKRRVIEERALNYVIERDGKTLFYGLDTSYILPETLELLTGYRFDAVVLDATFGHLEIDPGASGHHNFVMLQETIADFRSHGIVTDETVVFGSHISLGHVQPHDEVVDEAADMGITLAYDGLRVNV